MLKPQIPVAKEGYPFIGYAAFLTLISALSGYPALTLLLVLVTTFVLMFFRDPERVVPEEENTIISPADGKIIFNERVRDERFSAFEVRKISIFMNVFNVHVNRIPATGRVKSVRYVPGVFLSADNDNAHLKNEYCAVTMTTETGKEVTFVQIAGLIARRIVCWLEADDAVAKGQRFGLIRFGSRVDMYLPLEALSNVEIGQKVRAGETVIARLN